MQRTTFDSHFAHSTLRPLHSCSLLLFDVPPPMFSPLHDSTILLLYADLFLSKVRCTPLFRFVMCIGLSPWFHMAIETETFHLVEVGRFRQRRPSNPGQPGTCSVVSKAKVRH